MNTITTFEPFEPPTQQTPPAATAPPEPSEDEGAPVLQIDDRVLQSLSALRQLPGELPRAYAIFTHWVTAYPQPSLKEFREFHNITKTTLGRWRRIYRWDERLTAVANTRAVQSASSAAAVQAPSVSSDASRISAAQSKAVDFRAETLDLARAALQRWQSLDDDAITLPGITRVLELALKLTGQNKAVEPYENRERARERDLRALIPRAYGEHAAAIISEPASEAGAQVSDFETKDGPQ